MLCKYCHYEFYVSADSLGSKVRCPNCTGTVNVVDKQIICPCPECGGMLDISIWMLGSSSSCPHCQKSIILSLGEDSAKYLPESPKHTEMLKSATHKAGDIIGKYRVIRCLGIGGMGEVYLVEHTLLNHRCALKLLKNEVAKDDPEMRARLLREARLASQIQHKNLIAVLDAELDEKTATGYIVMEYIDGVSIEQVLVDGPMLEERALEIISEVAEALKVASEHKIIHRDIKPANIMLSRTGEIKVADLGIAKVESDGKQNMTLTMDNAVLGTPYYASPEQLRSSHQVDCRADIYSLGATLYHMLTGKRPFDAESLLGVMCNVLEKDLPMAHTVNPEISLKTSELISRMMAKKREDRPDDFGKLLDELNSGRKVGFTALLRKKLKAVLSFKYAWFAFFALLLVCGAWLTAKAVYGNKKTAEPKVQPVMGDEIFEFSSDRKTLIKCINKKIIEAVIPPGVTTIGKKSFSYCNSLLNVTIPDSVTTIEEEAFYNCFRLINVTIPSSVTRIGHHAFSGCLNLPSITIPNSVVSIGDGDFGDAKVILAPGNRFYKSDSYGAIITKDNKKLIYVPNNIRSYRIPSGVTTIGDGAFSGCMNLTSVTIPDSVTEIGNETFYCIQKVTLAPGNRFYKSDSYGAIITKDNKKLIYVPKNIESYRIPSGVTTIGNNAFRSCRSLTSVTIPDSVTSIRSYAFSDCSSLTSITIPGSVTTIEEEIFSFCNNLKSVTIPAHLNSQSSKWNLPKGCKIKISEKNSDNTDDSISSKATKQVGDFTLSGDGKTLVRCTKLDIVKAEIPQGVTAIGEKAFENCRNLGEMVIPDSVTAVANNAFLNCSSLNRITIPAHLYLQKSKWKTPSQCKIFISESSCKRVGNFTLSSDGKILIKCANRSVKKAVIPPGVTMIGTMAFYGCDKLTSITIPDSVTTIGDRAFYDCISLTSITIPNSVTTIGDRAFFRCRRLTSITLPDSVTTIGESAFDDCWNLTSITIPGSVTAIGDRAFAFCCNMTSVTIPDSVTTIGDRAFDGCRSLTSITIPDRVTSIGNNAFSGCRSLTSITIPNRVTTIGNSALAGINKVILASGNRFYKSDSYGAILTIDNKKLIWVPKNIKSYRIPSGVTTIGDYAFSGCRSLTSVTIPDSVTTIGEDVFGSIKKVIITPGNRYYKKDSYGAILTIDNKKLIWVPKDIKSYRIPSGVTKIGDSKFSGCIRLTSITIPDSVTSIGEIAFNGCRNLTSITIPSSVTTIGDSAFWGCRSLKSVTIPAHFKSQSSKWQLPKGCKIKIAGENNDNTGNSISSKATKQVGDFTLSGDGKILIKCANRSVKKAVIPPGVTTIGDRAFSDCHSLTSVTLPDRVTTIGYGAFTYCSSLTGITLPNSVTAIGDWAFSGCRSLTSITIPDRVTTIGKYAFYGCRSLTSITIPDSVTTIGEHAFYGCRSLTSITIPDSVTTIGHDAFGWCKRLKSVTIPAHLKSQSSKWDLPKGCKIKIAGEKSDDTDDSTSFNTTNFTLSGDGKTLVRCTKPDIVKAEIPQGVTAIGEKAFENCRNLGEMVIPDSVTAVADNAFLNCSSLNRITIPAHLYLQKSKWKTPSQCEFFISESSCKRVGNFTLSCDGKILIKYSGIGKAEIPQGITIIGDNAFPGYWHLPIITIPNSVTTIGNSALAGINKVILASGNRFYKSDSYGAILTIDNKKLIWVPKNIKSYRIPSGVTTIGDSAFIGCRSLTSVTIPDSVTTIGEDVFGSIKKVIITSRNRYYKKDSYGAILTIDNKKLIWVPKDIKSYRIPSGVTKIGNSKFSGCIRLTSITIPDSVTKIGDGAFSGCRSLTSITIPSSVTTIGYDAFSGCRSLTSITIPSSMATIGDSAFSSCRSLTSITIPPNSVTTIGDSAFFGCIKLTSITIPNSVTKIGYSAFSGCRSLTSITIPSSVTTIGYDAFVWCESLKSVTIPAHLKSQSSKWRLPKGCKIKIARE